MPKKISDYDIERIKAASTEHIVDIIGKYTSLRKSGVAMAGVCPFCGAGDGGKKKPFSVNPRKGIWKCFACDKGGAGALSFVMERTGSTIPTPCEISPNNAISYYPNLLRGMGYGVQGIKPQTLNPKPQTNPKPFAPVCYRLPGLLLMTSRQRCILMAVCAKFRASFKALATNTVACSNTRATT